MSMDVYQTTVTSGSAILHIKYVGLIRKQA